MATQNLTRSKKFNHKYEARYQTVELDFTTNIATSADVYECFVTPPNVLIISAAVFVVTASDAATSAVADIGFAGGDTLIDGCNLKSAANSNLTGGTNAVVPQIKTTAGTVTFKPTYTGTTTVGKFRLTVGYIELDMTNGELTNFSST